MANQRIIINVATGESTIVEITDDIISIDISRHKEIRKNELNLSCESTITTPFQSSIVVSSTGKTHIYSVDRDDQRNMDSKLMLVFNMPNIIEQNWKTKDSGIVLHTRDEFIAVCLEIAGHIEYTLFKNLILKNQVDAAITIQAIDAIQW